MKNIQTITLSIVLLITFSCNNNTTPSENTETPKVQVKTATVSQGYLPDYIEISGKTIYLNKNNIVAPINGYVTKVNVQQGDKVSKGTVLFEMQSAEAYIMNQSDSLNKNYGFIKITAPTGGIISDLNIVQNKIYINQASPMCYIIALDNIKAQANVPFEYKKYAKIGQTCNIQLPDGKFVKATFSKVLPQMDEQAQTIKILANLNTTFFIPENMIVNIMLDKGTKQKTQILPKNCIMTDALMTKFWVMKLINDSIAVSIPVKIGSQTHTQVEILSPILKPEDKIISEGAYGLSDTVLVEIIK